MNLKIEKKCGGTFERVLRTMSVRHFFQRGAEHILATNLTESTLSATALTAIVLAAGTSLTSQPASASTSDDESITQDAVTEEGQGTRKASGIDDRLRVAQTAQGSVAGKSQAVNHNDSQLEEIIVTAQKRLERLIDVPISISTLSNEEISRKGVFGMADHLNATPGVTMQDLGVGTNAIVVRGISADRNEAENAGGASVGIYFGDVPLTGFTALGGGSADVKLVDMARVEVLRGPQGTLYGSSSLAGAVRNIPIAPNLKDFEGNIKTGISATGRSSEENYLFQGVLNVPLIKDKLAIRGVGYRHAYGGYIDNDAGDDPLSVAIATAAGLPSIAANRKDIADVEDTGGRFSVLWTPTENIHVQFNYIAQKDEQDAPLDNNNIPAKYKQTLLDVRDYVPSGNPTLEQNLDVSNLVLSYELDWGTFTSSSSWVNLDYLRSGNLLGLSNIIPGVVLFDQEQHTDAFSEEFRFVSSFDGPLQFSAGLYYEKIEQETPFDILSVFGDPAMSPFGDPSIFLTNLDTDQKQIAFFGEVSYSWQNLLTFTFGGRHFDYSRDDVITTGGVFSGGGSITPSSIDESDQTLKAVISYTPTESANIYFQWAEGFRLGRGFSPLPASVCDIDGNGVIDGTTVTMKQVESLASDTLDNYELGGKFAWLDNRLTTNAALYWIKWDGVPNYFVAPCGLGGVINSGQAKVRGAEFEAVLRLTDTLRLNLGTSYKDGELDKLLPGVPAEKGDRLPASADFNFSAGLQYDFPLFGHGAYVRGDYNYVGGYFNDFQEEGIESGKYHLGSIRFGISMNRVFLQAYVQNITDADEVTTDLRSSLTPTGMRLRPRTFGVEAQLNF